MIVVIEEFDCVDADDDAVVDDFVDVVGFIVVVGVISGVCAGGPGAKCFSSVFITIIDREQKILLTSW
jgi:acetyl-CoA carboxylase carboxyltransferase component